MPREAPVMNRVLPERVEGIGAFPKGLIRDPWRWAAAGQLESRVRGRGFPCYG